MCQGHAFLYSLIGCIILVLMSCSSTPRYKKKQRHVRPSSVQISKSGNKNFKRTARSSRLTGTASYYGRKFNGKKTANGERFNMYALTAAHKTLPFNTKVKVLNLENNKSVVVRINDRGPYKKGRIIDLSFAAAKKIDMIKSGTARVHLTILP